MIDNRQIRAARALLGWTQETLADASSVTRATIRNIENVSTAPRQDTLNALRKTLERAGVEFLAGSGVRMKDQSVFSIEGDTATRLFLEDLERQVCGDGVDVWFVGMRLDALRSEVGAEFWQAHRKRCEQSKIKEYLIFKEQDFDFVGAARSSRWLPEEDFPSAPLCVYGDRVAFVRMGAGARSVIIKDPIFAESLRRVLKGVWRQAREPSWPAMPQK